MLQTGWVEEVGSGVRNVNKYLPFYAKDGRLEFIEDDMFTTTVYLDEVVGGGNSTSYPKNYTENYPENYKNSNIKN